MAKKQVIVTLTGETKRFFEWLRKYESENYPTDAKTAAYLMKLGVEKAKELSARGVTDEVEEP